MPSYAEAARDARWTWKSFTQNAAMQVIFTKAYPNIAPDILAGCDRQKIAFPQALFLIAQALIEQSATVQNPAASSYRIFNMQIHADELATLSAADQADMEKRAIPVPGVSGVSVKRIASWEIIKGRRVLLKSPFFVFASMQDSVNHFLGRLSGDGKYFLTLGTPKMLALQTGYSAAFKVLQDPKSRIDDYTKKLQAAGYATAGGTYIVDIHNRVRTVLNDFSHMVAANKPAFKTSFLDWAPDQETADPLLDTMKAQADEMLKATAEVIPPKPATTQAKK